MSQRKIAEWKVLAMFNVKVLFDCFRASGRDDELLSGSALEISLE